MVIVPGENDLGSRFPQVATQWDVSKNGTLTPEACSPSSNRKVWWTCPLGHGYQAAVSARTASGSGCPYCAGRKVLSGFNDLATLEPAVAASWHPGTRDGHRGQPPEGLVAVPGGAQLESGGLFQNRCKKVRLPGMRRAGTPPAPTALRAIRHRPWAGRYIELKEETS